MERTRQIITIIAAILAIIILVLFARWVGDRLRERLLVAKTPTVNTAPKKDEVVPTSSLIFDNKNNSKQELPKTVGNGASKSVRTATYSAIPSTGPQDLGYLLIALFFLSGLSVSIVSRKAV